MEQVILCENQENRLAMERYMQNKFPFMGVRAPERKAQTKAMLKESKEWTVETVLAEIQRYYHLREREYQYIAADLFMKNTKRFDYENIQKLFYLIDEKAWWDSVDSLRSAFSKWCLANPTYFMRVFDFFTKSDSIWERRVALNLQLGFKEKTNEECLKQAILQDCETDEFFIQKAIGWSLREYSKTKPEWIRLFIEQHPTLSPLAVREGSKYL